MSDWILANPWWLSLLVLLALALAWDLWRYRRRRLQLRLSDAGALLGGGVRPFAMHVMYGVQWVGLALLVVAMARPQIPRSDLRVNTEGIDIVIALDVSTSMLARDFKPDRLEAAKAVAKEFVQSRPNDRIGLVIFAGEAFTQCPITIDHDVVAELLGEVATGVLDDGTAIGSGLGIAVGRLKDSEAFSKVVILMTDGVNNSGLTDPLTAADLAEAIGVRVHTIGVGTEGTAPYPVKDFFGNLVMQDVEVEIDEDLLQKIAAKTGGMYHRATDNTSLDEIYAEIDQLEKNKVLESTIPRKKEMYMPFLLAGLALLSLVALSRYSWLRSMTPA